jgi:hypothetical protein
MRGIDMTKDDYKLIELLKLAVQKCYKKVLTKEDGEYHYQLGVFVRLCKYNAEYQCLKNGEIKTIPYKRLT